MSMGSGSHPAVTSEQVSIVKDQTPPPEHIVTGSTHKSLEDVNAMLIKMLEEERQRYKDLEDTIEDNPLPDCYYKRDIYEGLSWMFTLIGWAAIVYAFGYAHLLK